MKIAIACDHGGYLLKQDLLIWMEENDIEYEDFGCFSTESVDYPVFAEKAARAVADGTCDKGVVICTTGIGVSIAANKVPGIRCALCTDSLQAEMTRRHNDANMLAIGAGFGRYRPEPGQAYAGAVFEHGVRGWASRTPRGAAGRHPLRAGLWQQRGIAATTGAVPPGRSR